MQETRLVLDVTCLKFQNSLQPAAWGDEARIFGQILTLSTTSGRAVVGRVPGVEKWCSIHRYLRVNGEESATVMSLRRLFFR